MLHLPVTLPFRHFVGKTKEDWYKCFENLSFSVEMITFASVFSVRKMDKVCIGDKRFRLYIPQEKIAEKVGELARRMAADMSGKNPLFVVLLNGAFVFAADLLRAMDFPCEVEFMRVRSYDGTASTGSVEVIQDIRVDIQDRTVVLIEDIVDTGTTMHFLLQRLRERRPQSIKIAALLFKPESLRYDFAVDYAAFRIPRDFIVGYGLDYNEQGRNLKDIYVIDD